MNANDKIHKTSNMIFFWYTIFKERDLLCSSKHNYGVKNIDTKPNLFS